MDAVQGSIFSATQEVYDGFYKELAKQKLRQTWTTLLPNHCFIPSVSAIGFRNSNFNWNTTITNRNLLCNNEVFFDNYFIPSTNEEHITLTPENVAWLTQEIDKGQPNCFKICSFSINGAYNLCINSDITYTLDVPVPSGCSTVWESSNAYQIISSNNNSVTIRGLLQGIAFVNAKIINPCGADMTIKKEIYVGAPFFSADYNNGMGTAGGNLYLFVPGQEGNPNYQNNVCMGYNFPNVYIDGFPSGTNTVNWGIPSGYSTTAFGIQQQTGNRAYFNWYYGGFNNPPGYLQGTVSNSCGSSSQIFAFKQVNCGTPGGDPCTTARSTNYFTISPNPASDNITIGIGNRPAPVECNNLKALNTSNGIVFSRVNIYNNTGTLVKAYKTTNAKTATIQIANLIAGSYLVEIMQEDYVEKHQLIVQ